MPNLNDLNDTGVSSETKSSTNRGGRVARHTGVADGVVHSEPDIDDGDSDDTCSTRQSTAVAANFRRQLIDSQGRDKLSPSGEEYLEKFTKQLEKDNINLHAMPINGAYIVADDQYGILIVFEEAARRSTTNEFVPQANVIDRIMNDNLVIDRIKELNVEVLTGILLTPEDYGTKDENKWATAANRIRNYINLALNAEVSLEELENYQFRIITNPTVIERNLIKYSPHGVPPYFMYGACVEICMDDKLKDNRRSRRDYKEEDLEWSTLFTIGGMTEFAQHDHDDDAPNIPLVSITAYEGSFLSVKFLPFVLAVATEIFIKQDLWLEPFKNFGTEGYNLGTLYIDPDTNAPSRLLDRKDMKAFLKEAVGDPLLCVDVQAGRFTFPGFEILANSDITRLQDELDSMNGDKFVGINDPVKSQVKFHTGYVADDGQLRDTRSIHYFRVVDSHTDLDLLDRFRNYFSNPEDRIQAIAEAGFNNYQGRTNMLTTVYPTTKYVIDAEVVMQMIDMTSVLNVIRNTTRDNSPAFTSDLLKQQGRTYRDRDNSLYNNRSSQTSRRQGIIFGGMRGRGRR